MAGAVTGGRLACVNSSQADRIDDSPGQVSVNGINLAALACILCGGTMIHALEPRLFLSFALKSGILSVTGTTGNNTVTLSVVGGKVRVAESGLANKDYTTAGITKIVIDGKAGNDKSGGQFHSVCHSSAAMNPICAKTFPNKSPGRCGPWRAIQQRSSPPPPAGTRRQRCPTK